jgi:hypothetical protein
VTNGFLDGIKDFRVQKITADDQTSSTLTGLAMYCYYRIFQKVILNHFQFFIFELVIVMMTCKTIDDIISLLNTSLDEQKHVETNIKNCSDGTDLMIFELVFPEPKVRDGALVVLFALFNTEIVNLNIDTMS